MTELRGPVRESEIGPDLRVVVWAPDGWAHERSGTVLWWAESSPGYVTVELFPDGARYLAHPSTLHHEGAGWRKWAGR
jgi:hypothetical protein